MVEISIPSILMLPELASMKRNRDRANAMRQLLVSSLWSKSAQASGPTGLSAPCHHSKTSLVSGFSPEPNQLCILTGPSAYSYTFPRLYNERDAFENGRKARRICASQVLDLDLGFLSRPIRRRFLGLRHGFWLKFEIWRPNVRSISILNVIAAPVCLSETVRLTFLQTLDRCHVLLIGSPETNDP